LTLQNYYFFLIYAKKTHLFLFFATKSCTFIVISDAAFAAQIPPNFVLSRKGTIISHYRANGNLLPPKYKNIQVFFIF